MVKTKTKNIKEPFNNPSIKKVCCICNKEFNGYGNNALPLKKGICCDSCNMNKVIPARLNIYAGDI